MEESAFPYLRIHFMLLLIGKTVAIFFFFKVFILLYLLNIFQYCNTF